MKYAVEMSADAMVYIHVSQKQVLEFRGRQGRIHREHDDHTSLLLLFNIKKVG
jgi:hypothetical protein